MMNRLFIIGLMLLSVGRIASANIDVYEFSNEENRLEYHALTKELRCPKCQNQDIADSNAPIASDMRREVHRLLEEGKNHDQIVQFMVDRFGDFVTYKPKVSGATFMLWYGPWIFIAIGLLIIGLVFRKKVSKKRDGKSPETSDNIGSKSNAKDIDRVQALLKEYDETNEQDKS